jgi:gliding motility-associated-like protein
MHQLRKTILTCFISVCCYIASAQPCNFTINKPSGCVPLSGVNFTDITAGTVTRNWNLGNGTIINNGAATVGTNYLTAGTFNVKLTVFFSTGDSCSITKQVVVHPKPIANFFSLDTAGCVNHTASFTDQSTTATGVVNSWQWDFGAGGSSLQNPTFTFTAPGNYQVSLVVSNSWGCISEAITRPNYIKVYPRPVPSFTTNTNHTCDTVLTIQFTNATTGTGPITYLWNFGDGQTSTQTNPSHTYTGTGVYNVTLTAQIGNTCTASVTTNFFTNIQLGKPKATIVNAPDTVCVGQTASFAGSATPAPLAYSVKWYFTDDNTQSFGYNATHNFTTPGLYDVLFIASSLYGCADTTRKQVYVKPGVTVDFSADKPKGCAIPWTVQFSSSVSPLPATQYAYLWNFGDGQISTQPNPQHTYNSQGFFTVTLTVTDTSVIGGCTTVKQKISFIEVRVPVVNFSLVPPAGCKPLPVVVTAQVSNILEPITQYQWNFGDGFTQTTTTPGGFHIYTQTGIFNIQLTITTQQGCVVSSIIKPVVVIDTCVDDGSGGGSGGAGFLVGKTCANKYGVTFTDTVRNTVVQSWDFGDGTTATIPPLNPISHQYSPPQKEYYVTVIRLDTISGLLDTGTKKVVIIDEKANFIPSILDICANIRVNFTTIGIDSSKINRYTWNFGDGSPVQIINNQFYYQVTGNYLNGNTSHIYTDTGVFFVQLIIEDKLGCRDTSVYTLPIVVRGPSPLFGASPRTSCVTPFTVSFTDSSLQNGSTPITEWSWNFGDGSPLLVTNVDTPITHIYNNNSYVNFYTVTLNVKDAAGCTASLSRPAYIKAYKPRADFFSFDTLLCGRYNVFLYNISQAYNANYTWHYGDGATSTGVNGAHTYAGDGLYNIKLVVTDENGCMDSITKPAYIKIIKPRADFTIDDTTRCAPAIIRFRDSSEYATGWEWDFGDGGTGSLSQNPAPHIYAAPGFYTIKLKIRSVNNCTDSISKMIRVRGPIGSLITGPASGCKPYTINMRVTGQFISTYAWDFNDGTPVSASTTDSIVSHTYPNAGKYLPNVVLTSPEGCPYTLRAIDTVVVDSAKAAFTYNNNACANVPVQFTNTSIVPSFSSIIKYKWLFGDGGTDSVANPLHNYASPGVYDVTLIIQTLYGCTDTLFIPGAIVVHGLPVATIAGDTLFCRAGLHSYTVNTASPDPVTGYEWFVNGNPLGTASGSNTISHFFNAGSNLLQVKLTTVHGCSYTANRYVNIDSVKAGFAPNVPLICANEGQVQFFNSTYSEFGIQQYNWLFGDGTASIDTHPTHAYTSYGDYTVTLIATSIYGCKDTLVKVHAVRVHPPPKASIIGDSIRCTPGMHTYIGGIISPDAVGVTRWFVDNVLVSNTQNLQYNFSPGVHQLMFFVKTVNDCFDTAKRTIIVDSLKAGFTVLPDRICADEATIQFTNTSGGYYGIISYQWFFGDGQNAGNANPSHHYAQPGVYDVRLVITSQHGCTDTLFIPQAVRIYKPPRISIAGDSIRCRSGVHTYAGIITSPDAITQKQWWVNGIPVSNNTNLVYAFNAGNHTLRFAVATINGCTDTVTRQIIIDSVRSNFTVDRPRICNTNGTVQFTNTSGGRFTLNSYQWNFGNGATSVLTNPSNLYAAPGHYTVRLIAGSVHGCADTVTKTDAVIIYAPPVVSIVSETEKCRNKTMHFSAAVLSEDTITTYTWRINNIIVSTDTAFDRLFTTDGNYIISLNVKTRYGCDVTVTKNITIHPLPVPNAAPDTLLCNGTPVRLHAADGVQYLWLPATGLNNNIISNPTATPIQTTLYTVKVTNGFGCEQTDSVLVRVDQPILLQEGPDQVICERGTVQLTATGNNAARYEWTPATGLNNPNIPNPLASPTQTTNYRVVAYSGNVCKNDTAYTEVIVEADPRIDIGPDIVAQAGTRIILNPTLQGNITQYNWQPATGLSCTDCPITQFAADKNITYKLTVTTEHGCVANDEVNIVVTCNKGAVYIPSAFTPNNDGVNDKFFVQGFGLSIVKSFRVFNRWGKLVFSRTNFVPNSSGFGWDGLVEGKRVNETTAFVYQIDVVCASDNKPFSMKGTVILIR